MLRTLLVLVLLCSIAIGASWAAEAAPAPVTTLKPAQETSAREGLVPDLQSEREDDGIVDIMPVQGTLKDAVTRSEVIEPGDEMAVYEAPLPVGGLEMAPGDVIAPPN